MQRTKSASRLEPVGAGRGESADRKASRLLGSRRGGSVKSAKALPVVVDDELLSDGDDQLKTSSAKRHGQRETEGLQGIGLRKPFNEVVALFSLILVHLMPDNTPTALKNSESQRPALLAHAWHPIP